MSYTIAVDFDGVLHSYTTPWLSADMIPDPPVPGAIEWLNEITKRLTVVIHTTRGKDGSPFGRDAVQEWLRANGYVGPELLVTDHKIPALVYLDDRALRFDGTNFPTADEVHRLRPWNKAATSSTPKGEAEIPKDATP
jgi:hypothetical protein